MTDTEKPLTVRAWFYHNGAWGIALARWRATHNSASTSFQAKSGGSPTITRAFKRSSAITDDAIQVRRATDNDPRDDMLDCPVDTHVGQQCLRLKLFIDRIEALGAEPDDVATMRHAAIRTMAVWYFG